MKVENIIAIGLLGWLLFPKKNNPLKGNDDNKIIITWSSIERLFYVYYDPQASGNRNEWIEIGYQQSKPTLTDIKQMLEKKRNP